MKKIAYTDTNGIRQNIYTNIDRVYGGWIATTEGNPTCLNELEDAGAYDEIDKINDLIATGGAEEPTERDIEYVNGTLEAWGV